ncbi:hypothetical protein [Bradyrhizobium betae]|uniref:Helix-turn-helix domain-containing protein n=1 Tax=Bradyrhizobium betae TaxID=244734 RepID=A0A5P6NZ83_9BRAD|nr:hypothetical protein [Bradyrhizobium betae]MCS3725484.1 putative transcriptional regulator [Bradyrhizobium betae]QFI71226.1 hypothetical protein F8237_01850 [Bradyrhizobium betae]
MIIRRRHTANYTTIGNVLFEDERLAADEVGILAYLLSRPHDWEVRRPALMRRWSMGRDAIKRVITNLVRFGWCRPEKTRLPNGTYFFIYEIRDQPGPELSDEEVRRALSLVSSEAAPDASEDVLRSEGAPEGQLPPQHPPTGYPSLADPPPADPQVAYKDIQTNDLPRTESTQKLERERERTREKHALNLAEFKRRWPTNADDDQTRVDRAWFAMDAGEGEAALAGITPFLEHRKKLGRKFPPAGFTYLEQKRWTLLEEQPKASSSGYARDSAEARAVLTAHEIAGVRDHARLTMLRGGVLYYYRPITPRLLALAGAPGAPIPPRDQWVTLGRQQAAAWESFVSEHVTANHPRLQEGSSAPWLWPPRKDGSLSTASPPDQLMSDQDYQDFKS